MEGADTDKSGSNGSRSELHHGDGLGWWLGLSDFFVLVVVEKATRARKKCQLRDPSINVLKWLPLVEVYQNVRRQLQHTVCTSDRYTRLTHH